MKLRELCDGDIMPRPSFLGERRPWLYLWTVFKWSTRRYWKRNVACALAIVAMILLLGCHGPFRDPWGDLESFRQFSKTPAQEQAEVDLIRCEQARRDFWLGQWGGAG